MTQSKTPFYTRTGYGWTSESPAQFLKTVRLAEDNILLIKQITPFTHLAFSGSSGCSLAFILSVSLGLPLLYVRKKGEKSHGGKIEGNSEASVKGYLMVDDFVCSGSTLEYIVDTISNTAKERGHKIPKCVGAYLYITEGCSSLNTKQGKIPLYGNKAIRYNDLLQQLNV